ncbi:AAA family ATPase [Methanobacterium aggregans]|uniref:AAA family ATPase n=1 Tax=Methanobacterium aggregans TaxID=1615586 RepID=UPI001AE6287C|nr:AAA family ATPase [Methanobacterium aggregans]MBP2045399.1 adenylate kinase [Methanobacterium aggregans]
MVQWNIAAVVGVPGVGKTSLCREAAELVGSTHVNYGDLMLEIARLEGLAETDSEMFSLDLDIQHRIWRTAALRASSMSNIILDLHGIDKSSIGYITSFPVEIISPDIVVIVESSYENVIKRRYADSSKKRVLEDSKSLYEHMNLLRSSVAVFSVFSGFTFTVVDNNNFKECLEQIVAVLKR